MFTLDEADDDVADLSAFLALLDFLFDAGHIQSYTFENTPDGMFVYIQPVKAVEYIVLNLQIS